MLPLERSARLRTRLMRALSEGSVSYDPEFDLWTVSLDSTDYHVQAGRLVSAKIGGTIDTWGSGVPLPKKVLADMARKAVRVPLREGDTYEVVKPGASLSTLEPSGVGSWTPREIPLAVGDIIWYKGTRSGFGDSPSLDIFEDPEADEIGEFRPNSWGAADQSYLKNIDFEAMLRHLVNISDPAGANDAEAEAYANRIAEMYNMDVMDVYDLAAGQYNALGEPRGASAPAETRKVAMRWVEETGVWAASPDEEHDLTVEMADDEDRYMIDEIERVNPESYEGQPYIWTIMRDTELLAGGYEDSVSAAKAQAELVFEDTIHGGVTALENIEEELHDSLGEYGWDIGPAEQHGYMVRDDSRNRHLFVTNGRDRFVMTIQDVSR